MVLPSANIQLEVARLPNGAFLVQWAVRRENDAKGEQGVIFLSSVNALEAWLASLASKV